MKIQDSKKYQTLTNDEKEIVDAYEQQFDGGIDDENDAITWIEEALNSYATYGNNDDFCLYILKTALGIDNDVADDLLRFINTEKMWNEYSLDYKEINGYYFRK